jgi:hypothetical protein
MKSWKAAFLCVALIGALYNACTIANDLALPQRFSDAGNDPAKCNLTSAPARAPASFEGGATDGGEADILFALKEVSFFTDGGSPAGFDLDQSCSCATACKPPSSPGISADCGRLDGIDNQGVAVENYAATFGQSISGVIQETRTSQGRGGLLLLLRGYSGAPTDPSVRVMLLPAEGVTGPDGGTTLPKFTEDDRWTYGANASVSDAGVVSAQDQAEGYVADGRLVAHFLTAELVFSSEIRIRLEDAVMTGMLIPQNAGTPLLSNVTFAGRWARNDALRNILRFSIMGTRLCSNFLLASAAAQICSAADLPLRVDASPSQGCDALSFGLQMQFAKARLGNFLARPPASDPCAEAGVSFTCP